MDLYNFTGWGFFVTVVSILITGSYIRQSLIGLAGAINQRFKDLESKPKICKKTSFGSTARYPNHSIHGVI